MPNESIDDMPQPGPGEIDQMHSDWEAGGRQAQKEVNDANFRELMDSTDRMIEMIKQKKTDEEPAEPAPTFEIPPAAAAELAAQERERTEAFDRLDDQAIFSNPVIQEKLAGQGLEPPLSAEEIEAREVAKISAHASDLHKPRQKKPRTLRRPLGPRQREIADSDKRVESEYGEPGDIR